MRLYRLHQGDGKCSGDDGCLRIFRQLNEARSRERTVAIAPSIQIVPGATGMPPEQFDPSAWQRENRVEELHLTIAFVF